MLTKVFQRVYHPGSPEVPAVTGGYICHIPPGEGYWETRCSQVDYPPNGSLPIPGGSQLVVVRDADGNVTRVYVIVCTSTWVSTGPAPVPVCSYIEPRAYQPAVRGRFEQVPIIGWDAGANSVQARAGDCEAKWTIGLVAGVYIGLTDSLDPVTDSARYAHAFYFHQSAGNKLCRIVEYGSSRSLDFEYDSYDEFRIRRMGALVTYWRNDQLLYTSDEPLDGEINVGSTLYASGDTIP